jgi:sucrose phosphorylase
MRNQVQLIAYVDRLSGGGFRELQALLDGPFAGLFGGAHLLPFFHPIDGADAGLDPIDHMQTDSRLGSWQELRRLAEGRELMADLIVNHVSRRSPQFEDFCRRGAASSYADLFLTFDGVFPKGATAEFSKPGRSLPFLRTGPTSVTPIQSCVSSCPRCTTWDCWWA